MRVHSWLSPACELRPSPFGGQGVFACRAIAAGELLMLWGGVIRTAAEIDALAETHTAFASVSFTVWEGFYMTALSPDDPSDDAEFVNHSCDPNAGMKGQLALVARRAIAAGEEVTFDYDTTESSPTGGFACTCGSPHCRRVIDGSAWQDAAFRERNRGWLSAYLAERGGRERH